MYAKIKTVIMSMFFRKDITFMIINNEVSDGLIFIDMNMNGTYNVKTEDIFTGTIYTEKIGLKKYTDARMHAMELSNVC